jgi:hypothetical protein
VYRCEIRSRLDFNLAEDLIVITAITGDEHIDYVELKVNADTCIFSPRHTNPHGKARLENRPFFVCFFIFHLLTE